MSSESSTKSLDARFAGGLAWTVGVKWATQIFTWGSVLLLTKLLDPSDYGTGSMASALFYIANMLAEFGVGSAVLHMPELTKRALAQLHTFSLGLCTLLFLLATAASPLVASFFHSEHLLFFAANNVILILTGLEAVPMGLLSRDMDYRRLSLAEAAMVIVQASGSVILAFFGLGFWALLLGQIAGRAVATIMVCSWKHVGFAWPSWSEIKAPFHLGRQLAVNRLAWAVYVQSDGIVTGRVLGSAARGSYGMAMDLATAPAEKVSTLLMRTATPLLANVKDDLALVRRYSLIFAEILGIGIFPLMAGLAMVAPLAVATLFGNKWAPAAAPLRLLAAFMIIRTMNTLLDQILVSQKDTKFTMRVSLINCAILPVAFVAGAHLWGTSGVASAWFIMIPLSSLPILWRALKKTELGLWTFLSSLAPALCGTAAMCAALWLAAPHVSSWGLTKGVQLAIEIGLGAIVYAGVLLTFFRERVLRYVRFVKNLRSGGQPEQTP